MKKINQIFVAMVLLVCNINFGQTHVITLNVNTAELTKDNVNSDEITYFTAPDTQIDVESPPEAFEITVEDGSTIVWEGVSTSSDEDMVDIFMIKHVNGPRIFSSGDINGNGNGKARGVVKKQQSDEAFKYTILFKVNRRGRMYKIDPKIKVRPRQ